MDKTKRKCPVCNSSSNTFMFDNRLAIISGKQLSNKIVACDECYFIFADMIAGDEIYSEYYQKLSKYDVASAELNDIDKCRVLKAVELVQEFTEKNAQVFDIGCGNSALLGALKDQGYHKLSGIDPAQNCSERALTYGINDVTRGSIVDFDLSLIQDADVILVMAVLEHLVEPRNSIQRVVKGMKIGAKLIIEVPNLIYFNSIEGEPYGEFSIEHIQFFSLASLLNMMAGLNLKIVGDAELELPHAGSLFAVFERISATANEFHDASNDVAIIKKYIYDSNSKLQCCFEKLIDKNIILYGAGAHSARLLPQLNERGIRVEMIVDSNPNYYGETLGGIEIKDPIALNDMSDIPILISSFRSESAIKSFCTERFANRLITFYGS